MSSLALSVAAPMVLMAVLLLASGLAKLRAAGRTELGVHLPSLMEVAAGLVLGFLATAGDVAPRTGLWMSVGGGLLVVGSSWHLWRRMAHRRHLRDLTEGRRLETFVRYFSASDREGS